MDRPMLLIPILVALIAGACAGASVVEAVPPKLAAGDVSEPVAAATGFDHTYATWDAVLRKHVDGEGMVDYGALGSSDGLARFVADIGAIAPEEVGGWSRDQQVAFYINAYNALTFQTIIDAMPIKSIMDIKSRKKDRHDPWEIARWRVAGRDVSLNWIEHTKLRSGLNEPRVHFVLVCAAKGCPTLPAGAVLPVGLDEQMEGFARAFFNDPSKNRADAAGGKIYLSRILEWYGDDFVPDTPSVPALTGRAAKEAASLRLLSRYLPPADQEFIAKNSFTVVFNEYDWALNAQ